MDAKELEQKLEKFKKYYYKGAGAKLTGLSGAAENVLNYPNEPRVSVEDVMIRYNRFIKNYPKINPEDVLSDPDFTPLLVIDTILPDLELAVNDFVNEPTIEKHRKINSLKNIILSVADIYRSSFYSALEELRKQPGYENYGSDILI